MDDTLCWQDSEVSGVRLDTGETSSLQLDFSAGWVTRGSSAAREQGFLKPVRMTLAHVRVEGDARLTDCIGQISEGEVTVDGRALTCVPLPWRATSPLTLTLRLRMGGTLIVHAQAAHCEAGDGARFHPSYAC